MKKRVSKTLPGGKGIPILRAPPPEGDAAAPEKTITAAEVLRLVRGEIAKAKQRQYKGVLPKKERGHG